MERATKANPSKGGDAKPCGFQIGERELLTKILPAIHLFRWERFRKSKVSRYIEKEAR
jgi:hypothetical protein